MKRLEKKENRTCQQSEIFECLELLSNLKHMRDLFIRLVHGLLVGRKDGELAIAQPRYRDARVRRQLPESESTDAEECGKFVRRNGQLPHHWMRGAGLHTR